MEYLFIHEKLELQIRLNLSNPKGLVRVPATDQVPAHRNFSFLQVSHFHLCEDSRKYPKCQ